MAYTVKEIAEMERVTQDTVLSWISRKELAAYNVGRAPGLGKPRWRISEKALEDFRQLRTPADPKPTPKPKRRKKRADVVEFYK